MAKRTLTRKEEFEILTLVLDKFLWISVALVLYGLWRIVHVMDFRVGFWVVAGGIVLLLIFMGILVREYEIAR